MVKNVKLVINLPKDYAVKFAKHVQKEHWKTKGKVKIVK